MTNPIVIITGLLPRRILIIDWIALILIAIALSWRLVAGTPPNWGTVIVAVVGALVAAELAHHYAVKWVTGDESRIPPRPDRSG